jgi:hypothetical protein
MLVAALMIYIAASRINELAYAFYSDSLSKLRGERSKSALKPHERMTMLFKSFIGLSIEFAVIYYFLAFLDDFKNELIDFRHALYFSAATISGIGQEGQEVNGQILRALHVYEGIVGVLLLVLAVSIYVGRAERSEA